MPTYTYKIITKQNTVTEGRVDAWTASRARALLASDGATIVWIEGGPMSFLRHDIPLPFSGFSKPDQIHFFRNLGTMLSAGLSLADALHTLKEQTPIKTRAKMFEAMAVNIENGKRLSDAMRAHPHQFSTYLLETVAVGEVTGRLTEILDRIADDLEHDYELTRRVRGAMAYPIVVIAVMVAVIIGLTGFILPKIAEIFTEMNVALPLPTRILLGTSAFVRDHPFIVGGTLAALITAVVFAYRHHKGKRVFHYLFLKMPLFGELIREYNLARFFRALEMLFASGISLVRSIEVAKKTLRNTKYTDALDAAHVPLLHGAPLSDTLKPNFFLFPLQARRIVEVGERTGRLEDIFRRVAAHYERALKHKTQMLSSLIEPLLILMIGVVVGGLALSVFLPIYQASSVL